MFCKLHSVYCSSWNTIWYYSFFSPAIFFYFIPQNCFTQFLSLFIYHNIIRSNNYTQLKQRSFHDDRIVQTEANRWLIHKQTFISNDDCVDSRCFINVCVHKSVYSQKKAPMFCKKIFSCYLPSIAKRSNVPIQCQNV